MRQQKKHTQTTLPNQAIEPASVAGGVNSTDHRDEYDDGQG